MKIFRLDISLKKSGSGFRKILLVLFLAITFIQWNRVAAQGERDLLILKESETVMPLEEVLVYSANR
jgi:hypothetical protein